MFENRGSGSRWFGVWLGLAGAFTACGPASSARAPRAAAADFPIEEKKLPNGIAFVAHRDSSQGLVAAVLVMDVGSGSDPEGKEGVAHAVEHLVFRAQHQAGTTIQDRLESIGAKFNAWTNVEETTYHVVAPAEEKEALLGILADIVRAPLEGVEDAAFQAERNVVENERRFRDENGFPGEISARLGRALYGDTFYGKPIGGTAESLSKLTLEDAKAFATAEYDPRRVTVLVAGKLGDASSLTSPFEEVSLPDSGVPSASPEVIEPAEQDTPIEQIEAAVGSPELWVAWRFPGAYGDDRAVLDAVEYFSHGGGGRSRDDVVSLSTFVHRGRNVSTLYARARLTKTDALDAVRFSIFHDVRSGIGRAADFDERNLGLRFLATDNFLENEDLETRAVNMALGAHFRKSPLFLIEQADRVNDVESGKMLGLSHKYLVEKRGRALLVVPGNAGASGMLTDAHADDTHQEHQAALEHSLEAVRVPQGALQQKVLDNGLTVLALPRPGSPFFTGLLGFMDGTARTPTAVARAAGMATASYISKIPKGIAFSGESGSDSVNWSVRSDLWGMNDALEQFSYKLSHHEVFWKPDNFLEWLKVEESSEKPLTIANRELRHALLGDSPLVPPSPHDLDTVQVTDIRKWRDEVFRPENGVLVLVGPDQKTAFDAADEYMASWKRSSSRKPVTIAAPLVDAKKHEGVHLRAIARSGLEQTELAAACLLPPSSEKSEAVEDLLEGVLDENLERKIRKRAGSSYGVWVGVERARGGTAFLSVTTAVGSEHLNATTTLILRTLTGLEPVIDEGELPLGRWRLLRNLALTGSTTPAFADRIFEYYRLGWSMSALETYPERVQKVDLDQVTSLLEYCGRHLVLTAVGDADSVKAAARTFKD